MLVNNYTIKSAQSEQWQYLRHTFVFRVHHTSTWPTTEPVKRLHVMMKSAGLFLYMLKCTEHIESSDKNDCQCKILMEVAVLTLRIQSSESTAEVHTSPALTWTCKEELVDSCSAIWPTIITCPFRSHSECRLIIGLHFVVLPYYSQARTKTSIELISCSLSKNDEGDADESEHAAFWSIKSKPWADVHLRWRDDRRVYLIMSILSS